MTRDAKYREAIEASDAIGTAADLIIAAAKLLDGIPSRFLPDLEAVEGSSAINAGLGKVLVKLSDRIGLAADAALEQAA